jgi:hypothetical protein
MTTHHIVAMLMPAWGHTVGYIYLAAQLLQKDPTLVITMVQHNIVGGWPGETRYAADRSTLSPTDGEGIGDGHARHRQAPNFGRRRQQVRLRFCISSALTISASI